MSSVAEYHDGMVKKFLAIKRSDWLLLPVPGDAWLRLNGGNQVPTKKYVEKKEQGGIGLLPDTNANIV